MKWGLFILSLSVNRFNMSHLLEKPLMSVFLGLSFGMVRLPGESLAFPACRGPAAVSVLGVVWEMN